MSVQGIYDRTERLVGTGAMAALSKARVIIFGVGGVGSWCAEGLLRSGVTDITLVDADRVAPSNINRQVMATSLTVGKVKVDAMKEHLLQINPSASITALQKVYCEETASDFDLDSYDYIVDAIDSLKDKILLIINASASKAKFLCALGAALKMDPLKIRVAEFWEVRGCPLGAAIRKKMKREGRLPSKPFLCVYDDEVLPNLGPDSFAEGEEVSFQKAQVNGSLVHITSIFGMTLSGLIVKDICETAQSEYSN